MATASCPNPGPLSRKRKASGSPCQNMEEVKLLQLRWLRDTIEELDEAALDRPLRFNSIGDARSCDVSVFGPARFDEEGNPAFYFPDISFDHCFSDLPGGLHPDNVVRYKFQVTRLLLLMHIWLVQLGDIELRTLENIQRAHAFWNSMDLKTVDGRTYAYYQNWIPDAIWRLRRDIKRICGHRTRKNKPRPGPVKAVKFPLLSEGRKQCKARHEAFLKREEQVKDESKKATEHQSMKTLCSQVGGELTDGGPSKPTSQQNKDKADNSTSETENKPRITTYPSRITRSRHAMMEMQREISPSYSPSTDSGDTPESWESDQKYPAVDIFGHAIQAGKDIMPIATRSKAARSPDK
ncbi:hypothetical protein TESG_04083 [Trichophyton tonsurans CBS 112818]|uniref:Uncharacterized protein n=1 Tax=Trichophyton tonsurans (strain CBS 112818) TaxID=647933 RepID=F2RZA0_TRIT1|nr:hypothetical protein TESG_04083 [Trichophyton tonsurans CBS 112818]